MRKSIVALFVVSSLSAFAAQATVIPDDMNSVLVTANANEHRVRVNSDSIQSLQKQADANTAITSFNLHTIQQVQSEVADNQSTYAHDLARTRSEVDANTDSIHNNAVAIGNEVNNRRHAELIMSNDISTLQQQSGIETVDIAKNAKAIQTLTGEALQEANRARTASEHVASPSAYNSSTATDYDQHQDGRISQIASDKADVEQVNGVARLAAQNTLDISANSQRVDDNSKAIVNNGQRIDTNTAGVAANRGEIISHSRAIAGNSQAISRNSAAIEQNSKRIDSNSKGIAANRKAIKRVGAMASASSNLHYNRAENGYAMSVGEYDGSTAIAAGVQFNTSANTAITVQASYDGDAVGASVGFHGSW